MSQLAMYKRLQTRENKSINYFFMNYKMCSQHTHECLSMLSPIGIFPIVAYFQSPPLNSPYIASQCAFLSGFVWLVVLLTCWIFQCYQENRGGWRRNGKFFLLLIMRNESFLSSAFSLHVSFLTIAPYHFTAQFQL